MNKKNNSANNSINPHGGDKMAKAGMRRPDPKEPHGTESNQKLHIPKNELPPVPEVRKKG